MTTGRHLVHESIYDEYVARLAEKAAHLPVGDPATEQVALGPIIDAGQRDKVHALVTASVDAGARLAAGGEYEGLFYRPTVLADVTAEMPAYAQEVFGPVAPVCGSADLDEAAKLAARQRIRAVARHPDPRRDDAAWRWPSGSRPASCTSTTRPSTTRPTCRSAGSRRPAPARGSAAAANIEAFTETRWVTMRGGIAPYPF